MQRLALCVLLLGLAPSAMARGKGPPGHVWPPSAAMKSEGQACLERLSALGIEWTAGSAQGQIVTPVEIPSMRLGGVTLVPIWRKGRFPMDCHLAEALFRASFTWNLLGVRELRFSSIYDHRNVRVFGGETRRLSRHALGLAIDIYEIVDARGRTHAVADHYWSLDLFLPSMARLANAFGYFRTVMTPLDDWSSHDDHFHLEARVEYPEPPRRARKHRKDPHRRGKARSRRSKKPSR